MPAGRRTLCCLELWRNRLFGRLLYAMWKGLPGSFSTSEYTLIHTRLPSEPDFRALDESHTDTDFHHSLGLRCLPLDRILRMICHTKSFGT